MGGRLLPFHHIAHLMLIEPAGEVGHIGRVVADDIAVPEGDDVKAEAAVEIGR